MDAGSHAGFDLGSPFGEGSGELVQLGGGLGRPAVFDGFVEAIGGLVSVGGFEHRADLLFGLPAVGNLVVEVAGVERPAHPVPRGGAEALGAHQQQFAGAVERVAFAAPVSQGVVLGAAAALVERPVRQAHDAGTGPARIARRRPAHLWL